MKILWFISSIVIILTSCNNFICRNAPTENVPNQNIMTGIFDTINVRMFKTRINYKTTLMTGIIICKKITDSSSAGSFINEFGIKGFDFTITDNQAKLGYTFKKLDKWYIRKTLETDLFFLFSRPKSSTICFVNDSQAFVVNTNHNLHNVYYVMKDNKIEHADMFRRARKISSLHQYYDKLNLVLELEHFNGSLRYDLFEIKN
jgi:hypothetical protein